MEELDRGLFIVDITISTRSIIHVEIDKEQGYVSIEECVSVSRNVEHNLDREEQDFELHVSSAGLDKPLRVLPQFLKNIGREVELITQAGVKHIGVLVAVDQTQLTLETTEKKRLEGQKKKENVVEQITFPMSEIKETKIVISFKQVAP